MADPSSFLDDSTPTPQKVSQPTTAPANTANGVGKPNKMLRGVEDFLEGPKPGVKQKAQHDPGWLGRIEAATKWAAESPVAQGAAAVFGAFDNGIVGGELAASNHGNIGDIARGAWTGMTNPGQATANVHDLEKNWHIPQPGLDKHANIAQRGLQVAEDTALQSQSLAIPGLDIMTGAKWLSKIASKIPGVSAAATAVKESAPVDAVSSFFDADHELNKFVTPMGRAYTKASQSTKFIHPTTGKAIYGDPKQTAALIDQIGGLKPGVGVADFQKFLEVGKGQKILEGQLKKINADENILQALSSYQKDALFVLPFAHMKNITVLAGLGPGGLSTIAKGIGYAGKIAKKDPATLAELDKLDVLGIKAAYHTQGQASKFANVPIAGATSKWSNEILSTYDNGLRLAVAEKLRSRGMGDIEMASQVRDIMGDYLHPSDATQALRSVGANFPQWRLQIVPKAMFKATKEQPKAVKLYSRTMSNIANDITEPMIGASFDMGGPPEDAAKGAAAPVGTVNYLTSPSTLGPGAGLFSLKNDMQQHKMGQWAQQELEGLVPFGSVLNKIPGLDQFPKTGKHNTAVDMALGAAGIFMPDTQSLKQEKATMQRAGMSGKDREAELQMEGRHRKKSAYKSPKDYLQ